ncbi:MAG TPA: AI-2E family transporter [Pyrinomonadaceae bacterium]|nr:AI-2E family transporter [Pyrinomonadaceae bacterium]
MVLPSVNVESRELSDAQEAEETASRARLRVAKLSQRPFDIRSIALTGLFVLAVFYTVYFMRSILLPIVLAMLLSYLLRPIVRGLARLKIPLAVGAALLLIGFFGLIGYGISVLATPTAEWLQKAPAGFTELQRKLLPVKKSVSQVAQATGQIEKLASTSAETKAVELKRHPITETLFMRTPEFIASAVLSLILLYFLLVYDQAFIPKLVKLLPTLSDKKAAGVVPNSILNRRLKCLGQTHALAAKFSTDKSSYKWLSIQVVSSDKREIDCAWNCNGSEYCSCPPGRLR